MKTIEKIERLTASRHSKSFKTVGVRSGAGLNLDPYLNLDLFEMSEPIFPPHPHAGFSAVTYMLPESEGSFQNRDSLGDSSLIHPGDIHWTQAGSGMLHEEFPTVIGKPCLGFQIFVNLSRANKKLPPKAFHGSATNHPVVTMEESKLRILAGSYLGQRSQLMDLATAVTMVDVSMERNSKLNLALEVEMNWFIFMISGSGRTANMEEIQEMQCALLSKSGKQIEMESGDMGLRFLLCGGKPLNEPVVMKGPFAMTSEGEIAEAFARYQSGGMGFLHKR